MATKTRVTLAAQPRTVLGKQVKALRRQGFVPANIFGHGVSTPVQVDARVFERLRDTHQTAGLIDLHIPDMQPETVLIRHIARRPKTGHIEHIDFLRVRMNETLTAKVSLHISGESPAAKVSKGMVLLLTESVEIEALPGDLPEYLTVDASKLTGMDTVLKAGDLELPAGVKLRTGVDESIAKVQPPRGEAEAETPAAAVAPAAAPETPAS